MTSSTDAVEGVIKADVLGRMRTSAPRRESLLQEFESSGISATKFAELAVVPLAAWIKD